MNTRNSIMLSEHDIVKLDNSVICVYLLNKYCCITEKQNINNIIILLPIIVVIVLDYLHLKPRTVKRFILYIRVLCNIMYTITKTKRSKKYMFYIIISRLDKID
jgi:hypothetical protein